MKWELCVTSENIWINADLVENDGLHMLPETSNVYTFWTEIPLEVL